MLKKVTNLIYLNITLILILILILFIDLSKLFSISIRVPDLSLPALVSEFKSYLLARGSAINSEVQEKVKEPQLQLALKWTENFLNLTHWVDKICEECFKDNLKIIAGCNEAFIQLINSLERAPEFISLFIDYNMREDFKRVNLLYYLYNNY